VTDPISEFRAAVLARVGGAPEHIEPGRLQRFPTSNRRGDDSGWCRLFEDLHAGVYGDWREGISETWKADGRTTSQVVDIGRAIAEGRRKREAARHAEWADNGLRIGVMWSQCVPVTEGDPVMRYLERRRLDAAPPPSILRLHRSMEYWDGARKVGMFPAMVAPLMSNGVMVALHRTYLTGDGKKADVPTVKKLTPAAGPLFGAAIPFYGPRDGRIGVAEGIETALAATQASGIPTVAAYCAGALASYRWPSRIRSLVVFGDGDEAGVKAAEELRRRATAAGVRVEVRIPKEGGVDWADVWAARDEEVAA
jgi:phage/plasmid primase-like uncharacterized protein